MDRIEMIRSIIATIILLSNFLCTLLNCSSGMMSQDTLQLMYFFWTSITLSELYKLALIKECAFLRCEHHSWVLNKPKILFLSHFQSLNQSSPLRKCLASTYIPFSTNYHGAILCPIYGKKNRYNLFNANNICSASFQHYWFYYLHLQVIHCKLYRMFLSSFCHHADV